MLAADHERKERRADQESLKSEMRALFGLSMPLLMAYFGVMLLGIVDVGVVGRLGEVELAAAGIGNAIFFGAALMGMGMMLGLDPLISQALGASEAGRARELLWQGGWLALIVGGPLVALALLLNASLTTFGIEPEIVPLVAPYLNARLVGMLPLLVFTAMRTYLQALGVTWPLVLGVVLANVFNLPLSWVLSFGDAGLVELGFPALGCPAMGVAGAGWASTLASMTLLFVAALALRTIRVTETLSRIPRITSIRAIARLGTPIGLQMLAEGGSFSVVTFCMGTMGARILAAHNISLTLISVTFQVALAIGAAGSVRVGRAIGAGSSRAARFSGKVALIVVLCLMSVFGALFLFVPEQFAQALTNQEPVIATSVALLSVAAGFQLSDGVQAVAAGLLRGAGDTRWPLLMNLIGHYVIGLPLGLTLTFVFDWGATGLWWGLFAGLSSVAVLLVLRFWRLTSREIARVQDAPQAPPRSS